MSRYGDVALYCADTGRFIAFLEDEPLGFRVNDKIHVAGVNDDRDLLVTHISPGKFRRNPVINVWVSG
jgi:hypothetical protein